jgi:argininosuccinate synthase
MDEGYEVHAVYVDLGQPCEDRQAILDKANRIRLVRGKTNRQYLGELRESPELADLVGQTMIAFEDVFFGERTLTREQFEACYRRLDQFHAELELVVA